MAKDDQPTIIARHKSGKQLQVELSIADLAPPSECDGANGWQIICFVHDVEQKQQLRHGGFDLSNSLVLDQLHDALFVTNGRGKILWVNTTAVKMFAKRGQCEKSVVQKEQFCQQDSLYQLLCREDAELLEIDVKKFFLYNTEILRVRKVQAIRLDDSSFESTMVVSVLDQVKGTLCVFFKQDPDQLVTQTAKIDTPPEKLNSGVNVADNEIGFSSLTRGRKLDPPSHESITGDGIEMGDSVDDEDDDDSHPDGLVDVVYMDNHLVKHPSEQGENNQGNFSLNDRHSDNDDESESSDDEEDSILDDDFEFEDTILTYP
mmetsp:Transcript_37825/g.53346  ORF Transcript_37825/g.53346 Transcript_37825/m.53346 type:complete len:318 (+) Transcript_37825:97-1050(+)